MKDLETENAKLKRMYADLTLENTTIRDVVNRKLSSVCEAAGRRDSREGVRDIHRAGVWRQLVLPACCLTRIGYQVASVGMLPRDS